MIEPGDLTDLRTAAPDYEETERLKARLGRLRTSRTPFCLTAEELEPVFRWKLGSQYGRVRKQLARNMVAAYQIVTRAAFEISDFDDPNRELELRVGLLCSLAGVGIGIASAILALVEPDRYCVIDFRGWRGVFGDRKSAFTVDDYKRYLAEVRRLARVLAWPVQEVDLAIWEHDRRNHGRVRSDVARTGGRSN